MLPRGPRRISGVNTATSAVSTSGKRLLGHRSHSKGLSCFSSDPDSHRRRMFPAGCHRITDRAGTTAHTTPSFKGYTRTILTNLTPSFPLPSPARALQDFVPAHRASKIAPGSIHPATQPCEPRRLGGDPAPTTAGPNSHPDPGSVAPSPFVRVWIAVLTPWGGGAQSRAEQRLRCGDRCLRYPAGMLS